MWRLSAHLANGKAKTLVEVDSLLVVHLQQAYARMRGCCGRHGADAMVRAVHLHLAYRMNGHDELVAPH